MAARLFGNLVGMGYKEGYSLYLNNMFSTRLV